VDAREGYAMLREHTIDHFRAPGDARWALYRFGPHGDLVGRPVSELPVAAQSAGSVQLAEPERFDDVDVDRATVPGVVWGTVTGIEPAPDSQVVAVAVNGTVAATTRVLRHTSGVNLEALPPEFLWRDGHNDVSVYLVDEQGGGAELRLLTRS
jgi:hypothetical protein